MSDLSKMSNEDLVFATEDAHFSTIGGCSPEEGAKHMNLRAELLRRLNRRPKALRWDGNDPWRAETHTLSSYMIGAAKDKLWLTYGGSWLGIYESLEEARVAAQAHHETELAKWFEESPNA